MKKLLIIAATVAMSFALLAGCSAPAEPLNLDGNWKQVNSNSDTSYQEATIEGDTITIDWQLDGTEAVYWVGSYTAPTEATNEYSWTSERDTSQTDSAIFASKDASKEFTYKDGTISYEVTAMGVTMDVELQRSE